MKSHHLPLEQPPHTLAKDFRRYSSLLWQLFKIRLSHSEDKDAVYRRTIFYAFKSWGGVYIKFLQTMAGTSRFMAGWGGPHEMAVFSQAPREPLDITNYIDLTNFAKVSSEPVAAGSFALVYRGQLKTGEDVAIKILRPSICKNLQHDLTVLGRLCSLFTRFLPETFVDYNDAYTTCAKMFRLETDYEREMSNQEYFAKLYADNPNVVIPKVYRELSSRNVIVQDFITGPTLSDVMSSATPAKPATKLAFELTGSDLWAQITTVGGEALYTSICADYVYGDPHPGNIILLPENRIAFIDFGIIANKPSSHRAFYDWVRSYHAILNGKDAFRQLLETTITCFCPDVSLAMQRCDFGHDNLFTAIADAINDKFHREVQNSDSYLATFREGHLASLFIDTIGTKTINVKFDMANFELLKAIQAFLGSVTMLDNAEQSHSFASIMNRSMEYALARAESRGIPYDNIRSTTFSLTKSYELLVQTISSLANNDEYIFNFVKERIFA